MTLATATFDFALPRALEADGPPEARGLARDEVRLLAAGPDGTTSTRFTELGRFLAPGDLLVANDSATLPAALPADGGRLLHLSTALPGGLWVAEVRRADGHGSRQDPTARAGDVLALAGDATARLLAPFPFSGCWEGSSRLWAVALTIPGDGPVMAHLETHGRPIRYAYASGDWPLTAYQTVFGREPGSAEMPSAGRPFSARVLAALAARGVAVATITLHTGVASQEAGEAPFPERFRVGADVAAATAAARARGRRVVAVGTTVVRALESAADEDGVVGAADGWADVVITPERGVRAVDGIVTGLHAPGASHLALLEAVAGPRRVADAYARALAERFRWHEFGDAMLLLR